MQKSEKITTIKSDIRNQMMQVPFFLLLDLDIHFQSQTFSMKFDLWRSRKRWQIGHIEYCGHIGSNIESHYCEYCIPWPTFLGQTFEDVNYSETVRCRSEILDDNIYRFQFSPSDGTIANVELRQLDNHFENQIFSR